MMSCLLPTLYDCYDIYFITEASVIVVKMLP